MRRIFSFLLALLLVIMPIETALAYETVKVLDKPTTTVSQMKAWASNRGAHPEFINQANNFYNISIEYGVDPAVTYAQAAKETNFFNFSLQTAHTEDSFCNNQNSTALFFCNFCGANQIFF